MPLEIFLPHGLVLSFCAVSYLYLAGEHKRVGGHGLFSDSTKTQTLVVMCSKL